MLGYKDSIESVVNMARKSLSDGIRVTCIIELEETFRILHNLMCKQGVTYIRIVDQIIDLIH